LIGSGNSTTSTVVELAFYCRNLKRTLPLTDVSRN
jgi:hypothetical protein